MRIELNNLNQIVTSAHFNANAKVPALLINTKQRWVTPDRVANVRTPEGGAHITFEFDLEGIDHEDKPGDTVTLIAESNTDIERLKGIRYQQHEKDQLSIIFIDRADLL